MLGFNAEELEKNIYLALKEMGKIIKAKGTENQIWWSHNFA